MRALVTGSAGHLGEALMRTFREEGIEARGLDILPSPFTDLVGSVADPEVVRTACADVTAIFHAATLHKPHVATHRMQDFVETNIAGTLALLEEATRIGVEAFVFISTTSAFGDALRPPPEAPTVWVTEALRPLARNVYGVSKGAAESFCELFARKRGLPCVVLRTSRFFLEADDDPSRRAAFADDNLKLNEYLHRRVDVADIVTACRLAAARARELGFGRFIISAPPPFLPEDLPRLRGALPDVLRVRVPGWEEVYRERGWRMHDGVDRVYSPAAAQEALGWRPEHTFAALLERLRRGEELRSPLARAVGSKPYHPQRFEDGPYPVADA